MRNSLYLLPLILLALHSNNHSCGPKFLGEYAADQNPQEQPRYQAAHHNTEIHGVPYYQHEFPHEQANKQQLNDHQKVVIAAAIKRASSPSA